MIVYFDWNIFNKIEKLSDLHDDEQSIYSRLVRLVDTDKITVPYSNAHINDLYRGYLKAPEYIEIHLNTLKKFTKDLLLIRYWGEEEASFYKRDVKKFFLAIIEEKEATPTEFSKLMDNCDDNMKISWELKLKSLALIPIDISFRDIYQYDPIFNQIYSRTKAHMNFLSLCEDLYAFSFQIKTDYTLYKNYRKFLSKAFSESNNTDIEKVLSEPPSYLLFDKYYEEHKLNIDANGKQSDNIFDTFIKTDFKDYNKDARFANLTDDALHTSYASYCDYFITLDDRCYKKAQKVYKTQNIETIVCKPDEFLNIINE